MAVVGLCAVRIVVSHSKAYVTTVAAHSSTLFVVDRLVMVVVLRVSALVVARSAVAVAVCGVNFLPSEIVVVVENVQVDV